MISARQMPYGLAAALRAVAIEPLALGEPVAGPQVWTVAARVPPEAMGRALGMGAAFQATLEVTAVRIYQAGAWLAVEVPRADRETVPLARMQASGLAVQVGLNPTRRPVTIRLDAPGTSHVLVAGQTGSGKSVAMRTLAWGLAQLDVELVLIDTDADTWRPLENAAALRHAVVEDRDGAEAALLSLVREMERRMDASAFDHHIVAMIDEVQTIGPAGREAIMQIATRGRKAGCHVVVATQYVRSDVLDRRLTDQLGARILGRMQDGTAGHWAGSAAVTSLLGNGDMLVSLAGVETRCQIAYAPEGARAWERVPRTERVAPAPAGQETDPGHEIPSEALAWCSARIAIEGGMPGINRIAARFGIGNTKAGRWQQEAETILASQLSQHPRTLIPFPGLGETQVRGGMG